MGTTFRDDLVVKKGISAFFFLFKNSLILRREVNSSTGRVPAYGESRTVLKLFQ